MEVANHKKDEARIQDSTKPLEENEQILQDRVSDCECTYSKQQLDRQVLFACNVLTTFLYVGATLGWGPMQLMLESNGTFSKVCTQEERDNNTICSEQTSILVRIGLTISGMQVVSPLCGFYVDKVGPKWSAYTQACLAILGLSLVTLGAAKLWDAVLFVGFIVIALHTFLGALLIMQLGIYFEGHTTSRVIFILNTVFDGGTITNLILWGIQEASGASTPSLLGGYLIVGAVLYLISMYYWRLAVPAGSIEDEAIDSRSCDIRDGKLSIDGNCEEIADTTFSTPVATCDSKAPHDTSSILLKKEEKEEQEEDHSSSASLKDIPSEPVATPSEYVCVANRSPCSQLTSPPFLLLCLFVALNMAVSNWNLMTQLEFLASLGDDDNLYLTIFTVMTPVSILGSPFMDWSILKFGWSPSLQMINVLGVAFQLIKVTTTNLNVQILGFLIYSFYRAFLYGVSFSYLPTLVREDVISMAAGILMGTGGAANLCLLPAADFAIQKAQGDFLSMNVIILCISAPISILAICGLGWYMGKEAAHGPSNNRLSMRKSKQEEVTMLQKAPKMDG